ncbi:hypothetical protein P4H71_11085 [Paenibacillus kribbensis]|uniref:hypothetical protein n=1 Tax=Paenibacillus kribbensis TaxID=172713 RepID=UPI002DBB97E1|nr:hypothetical protein [Paenibacillus kribbensis]MEC0234871.1 hypothetical protein [Paenibacillus kribbensis]
MKKRKISNKLIQELNDLQLSRNKIDEFHYNFVTNSSRYVIFMHEILQTESNDKLIMVPVSQYIVSLVTCWETYFRDLFVFLLEMDSEFLEDVVDLNNIQLNHEELILNNVKPSEFVSKFFNFQNFQDTEQALSPLFENKDFFKTVSEYQRPFILINKRKIGTISLSTLFNNWYETIIEFFEIRHKIVHDANYRIVVTNKFISTAESICILLPQIIGQFVSEKYNIPRLVIDINNGNIESVTERSSEEIGVIFTVQDMTAKDWIIVNS